ncbi:hypothetical protein BD770DRAFT_397758 [Pilaira anomala]|nr:hypothetical protein BD770DRAFT_397758 [Pilaira anomala]
MKQHNSASKKIRMTMACERCRSKKVKCDFTHPQCARCQQAKAQCSYDGSATQVDLFNLVKLNETVDILQKRVQSIETDIKQVCSNTQYVANEVRSNRTTTMDNQPDITLQHDNSPTVRIHQQETSEPPPPPKQQTNATKMNSLINTSNTEWKLSLTPKGLRVDTNIISLHTLYDILLSGVSQFDCSLHQDKSSSSQSSSSTETSIRPDTATLVKKKPLWKSRMKTFPLYSSSWEESAAEHNKCSSMIKEKHTDIIHDDDDTIQHMLNIFSECFLCLPCPDPTQSIMTRYKEGRLDPLLANSVFAWTARHGAIHHDLFPGKDPNEVGRPFFLKAKELIKERFMCTSVDTMHSLIIMYIYTIGIPSEQKSQVESEAYIYLGLAIRMCLDLKMHQESTESTNEVEKEKNRRYFWVVYFLETLGSMHSDKPFALPPKNMITVQFPTVLEHEEDGGELKYRVEFMIQRFKITRIYRNIIYKTTEEKPLLSQISAIDKELENWYLSLPSHLKYEAGDLSRRNWNSTSFKEQSCIKLNFEYNFQLCQLYGLFFNKSSSCTNSSDNNTTIEVLSRDICLKAAHNTLELLECWIQLNQRWCHFSIENLMMTTMIYSNILSQPNPIEQEMAKTNLEKMARILLSAPVRYHKYVSSLVNRIKSIFREYHLHTDIFGSTGAGGSHSNEIENKDNIHLLPNEAVTLSNPDILSNPYIHHHHHHHHHHSPAPSTTTTENFHGENMQHFSEFVYTPTLLDYNHHILSSTSFGKKPDYNAYRYSPPPYYTPPTAVTPTWTPVLLDPSSTEDNTTTNFSNTTTTEKSPPQYRNDNYPSYY